MVSLIKYEIKKNFLKKSILVAVLVFSVINAIKINSIYNENSFISKSSSQIVNSAYWELYEEYSGTITPEKIEKLMSYYNELEVQVADRTASTQTDNPNTYTGNLYTDYYLIDWYYKQPMEYDYMYKYNSASVVSSAKENMEFYKELGNVYKYRENSAIADIFSDREITDYAYTEIYQYYLEYDFSSLLVLLISIYGLVNVFVCERETDMDIVLITTIRGGKKTVFAKIIASIIFVFVICVWFWILDFVSFSITFGSLEATSSLVYSIKNFEYSPIDLTLIQYSVLSAGVKILGVTVIGMIFIFISSFFKNALLPFITNVILSALLIIGQELTEGSGCIIAKIINPFSLVSNSELFRKVEFVNVSGYPVLSCVATLITVCLIGLLFFCLIIFTAKRNTLSMRR